MAPRELQGVRRDLAQFVQEFQPYLGRKERCHWCGVYLNGLILDGERKSIEPMARRLAEHGNVQAMQQFVNQSPWPFEPVQQCLSELLVRQLVKAPRRPRSPRTFSIGQSALILDDTTFVKHGTYSVGVAPQWCGTQGRQTNCQTLVSWQYADPRVHFPLRAQLYLPEAWTQYPARLALAGVPGDRFQFREKWKISLELLDSIRHKVPHAVVLCDAGYGQNKGFLHELSRRKEPYIAQIPSTMVFWPYGVRAARKTNRRSQFDRHTGLKLKHRFATVKDPEKRPLSAKAWADVLMKDPSLWRWMSPPSAESTAQKNQRIQVAAVRVRQYLTGAQRTPGDEIWLMIEHYFHDPKRNTFGPHAELREEFKFYISTLPRQVSTRRLFHLAHLRWKIEQGYQQLKEELGLDHFEGRSWQGFHHHVTLCMMAFGFLLLQKKTSAAHSSLSPLCAAG